MSIKNAWKKKIFKNKWQAYWLAIFNEWFIQKMGIDSNKLRFRQHLKSELSHYALDTWDIEYHYKFGWKELMGCANRTQYDLEQHQRHSKTKLQFSETDKSGVNRYVPYVVAEPSVGLGRILLTIIADGYQEETVKDRKRVVLKIHPKLAPYDVAVFPLQKKPQILSKAQKIFKFLRSEGFTVNFDDSGSIGKRYRRHDEVGTPFCVTVDFETLEDEKITIRHRDSMVQTRTPIEKLVEELKNLGSNYSAAKRI
jgi:glycyl-tRNA synthetase